jgi:DNA-binding NtrC family response regulator
MKELQFNPPNIEYSGVPQESEATSSSQAKPLTLNPCTALRELRAEAEVKAISQALEITHWNRRRAAELLRISYRGLLYKIRQHNITAASIAQVRDFSSTPET